MLNLNYLCEFRLELFNLIAVILILAHIIALLFFLIGRYEDYMFGIRGHTWLDTNGITGMSWKV